MSFTKTYFLCPTSDFIDPPPHGPLFLGSILRSTSTPSAPLNAAHIIPVPNENPPSVDEDWKRTVSVEKELGLGIYAQFLQLATGGLGLGSAVDANQSNRALHTFAFESIRTVSFEPTLEYIEDAMKAPAVQMWLDAPKQLFARHNELFLVTGMKIVRGARIKYSKLDNTLITGNIGIDAAPIGMTFGPKGKWRRMNHDETEFNRKSEFIFAFRVKRLKFGRRLKVEEYSKGAFLAVGRNGHDDDQSVLVEEVDGSDIQHAKLVPDPNEDGGVYCVST